ncbi:MAG TPA: choice-of-anchor D domain-containing protein [Solirubrobacterales bacterium]|nr:choice-of-anchor D domain-containing protein [Solirubrobacterales bacterium]
MKRTKTYTALLTAIVLMAVPQAASALKFSPDPAGPLTLSGAPINMSTVGRFNADGRDDIAAVTDSNGIYVWYGQPTGGFTGGEAFGTGSNLGGAETIRSGDLNGDGDLDLLIGASRMWEVYLGSGNGQFGTQPDRTFEIPPAAPGLRSPTNAYSNTLGDVDHDGDLDFVVGMHESAVAVMRNNGGGSFSLVPSGLAYVIPVGTRMSFDGLYSPAIGDWNGDDMPDLAVALRRDGGGNTPTGVYVAENDGTGSYTLGFQGPLLAGEAVQSMLPINLNEDGQDDLVAAVSNAGGGDNIRTLLGSDVGPVVNPNAGGSINAGNGPFQMTAVNLDNRQRVDIAVGLRGARKIAGIRNAGDGSLAAFTGSPFDLPQIEGRNFVVNGVHSGDFNGDGAPDLAADSSHISDLNQARGIDVLVSQPDVSHSPATVDFGMILPGGTSDSKTVTITNGGTALAIPAGDLTLVGGNEDQFSLGATTCGGGRLSGNASCTQAVTFSPTSGGIKSTTLVFNLANHPDVRVPLTGIGGEPVLSGPSGTTHIGETPRNGTRTGKMTITSAGTAPVTIGNPFVVNNPASGSDRFSISTDSCKGATLAPAQTCEITVTFTPTASGFKSASIGIPSSDPDGDGTRFFAVDGTGIDARMSVDPAGRNFGPIEIGDSTSSPPAQTFTISSTGTTELKVTPISIGGDDPEDFNFVTPPSCGQVPAGGTCQFRVEFDPGPGQPGERNAVIVLANNTSEPERRLEISGTATEAGLTLGRPSVEFAGIDPHFEPAPTETLTINSTGTAPLRATAEITGDPRGAFTVNGDECLDPTGPGLGCAYTVGFDPGGLAPGRYTATLEITSNGGDRSVPISADVISGGLSVSPSGHDFGQIDVGASSSKEFTLTSTGTGPMVVESLAIEGAGADAFGITANECGDPIPSGRTCRVNVRYSPAAAGDSAARLRLNGNFEGRILNLSGTGKAIVGPPAGEPKLALTVKAPRKVKAGRKLVLSATVSNVGDAAAQSVLLSAKLPKKAAGRARAIQVPALTAGQSVTHRIKVKIKKTAKKGKKLAAVVTVGGTGLTPVSVTRKVKVR